MKSLVRCLALLFVTLGLVACGGGDKKVAKDEPVQETQPQMTDAEALVGTWGAGNERLSFTDDGRYTWEKTRPCGAPPCPKETASGTWQLRNDMLYLDPQAGGDRVLSYQLSWEPRTLALSEKKSGKSWTFGYGQ